MDIVPGIPCTPHDVFSNLLPRSTETTGSENGVKSKRNKEKSKFDFELNASGDHRLVNSFLPRPCRTFESLRDRNALNNRNNSRQHQVVSSNVKSTSSPQGFQSMGSFLFLKTGQVQLTTKQLEVGLYKKGIVTSVNKYDIRIRFDEDNDEIDLISEQLKTYLLQYHARVKRPRPGGLCAVAIDGHWLRAKVISFYELVLVDLGKYVVYSDNSGNLIHDLYFIDQWPQLNQWPELSTSVSIEAGGDQRLVAALSALKALGRPNGKAPGYFVQRAR